MWLGLSQVPAPVPAFAMGIYMLCAVFGALVYVSADEARWRAFLGPIVRLFALAPGPGRRRRLAMLCLAPLVAGWLAWSRVAPAADPGAAIRLQHPDAARGLRRSRRIRIPRRRRKRRGRRRCSTSETAGPATARPPTAPDRWPAGSACGPSTSPTAAPSARWSSRIPLWRVLEGHAGLPDIATPWNSAMPAWGRTS